MRAVVQRVKRASVTVDAELVGEIGRGLLVLVGVGEDDAENDVRWMTEKLVGLRIFEDVGEKMNLSVEDVGGEILLVSQFTLYGDCRKGKRPSFSGAALPQLAKALFEQLVFTVKARGLRVETGIFQADMAVELVNDGPVTLLLDSKKLF